MKKSKILFNLLITSLLASCGVSKEYSLEHYVRELDYEEGFTVCTFNDLHLSVLSDLDAEFEYYESVLTSRSKLDGEKQTSKLPNMLVLNGDTFMEANKEIVIRFFNWLDNLNLPFLFTYGNHDLQGHYGRYFIDDQLKRCVNCLNVNPIDDNIYGNSNSVVNIMSEGKVKWQVYACDSNTYNGLDYDVVHDDQVRWYEKEVLKAKEDNLGVTVPSLFYMHVPCEEFKKIWDEHGGTQAGWDSDSAWYMGESVSSGYRANDLIETMLALGSTKGIMTAHDHINNTDWKYELPEYPDSSIRLIFGTKTGRGIYHDPRIMGASFYTLKDDGSDFDLLRVNVQYDGTVFEMDNAYLSSLGGNE